MTQFCTINRIAVVLVPTQACLDWINSCPGENSLTLAEIQNEPSVYLIPEGRAEPEHYVRRHFKDDTLVVPDNSRMMYEALKAHNVAVEYLELPSGGHGLNGYKGPMWDAWQTKSLEWLAEQKIIPVGGPSVPAKAVK